MNPVWVLSVDLQTKTATFQSGLADAAKSARGAFTEIKGGSKEMGEAVSGNMMEARHGVILLGEEFGLHLPRGVTSFLASIGPVGAAMEAAFPFLAIAVGATILIEHLMKMHEAGEKLTEDQGKFALAANNAFNQLDMKLLQTQIETDELNNDHLGALRHQLQLIDLQSMAELQHSFEEVSKTADVVFAGLKTAWYQFGDGSKGAKKDLDDVIAKYGMMLSNGQDKEAGNFLKGAQESAVKIVELQRLAQQTVKPGKDHQDDENAYLAITAAHNQLKAIGVGWDEKEVKARQTALDALNEQVGKAQQLADSQKKEDAKTTREAHGAMSAQASAGAKEAAESKQRIAQQGLVAAKAVAEAHLTITRASTAERLAVDLDFCNKEYALAQQGNAAQIAALDKLGKDYPNQLKAMHDKALEETAQHNAQIVELTAKASVEQANRDLANLEQGEKEKIDATQKGSEARLSAINSALKAEESANLQDTGYYRELLTQRVSLTAEMAQEQGKLTAESGKQSAEAFEKAGEEMIAAQKGQDAVINSAKSTTSAQRAAEETRLANEEFTIQVIAAGKELAALDKSSNDYQSKVQDIQNKEQQMVQKHANDLAAIKEKAEIESNQVILSAEQRSTGMIADGLTKSIMGHQTWAKMVVSFGNEAVSGLIKNSLMIMMQQDKERLGDARKAATSAYKTGESMGPAGIVLGPVFAAAAFAGVMAFQDGGIVPGVGRGDIVPAMLEPGEGVLPKGLMAQIADNAKNGTANTGPQNRVQMHIHMSASALDSDGVDTVFEKHADTIQKHFERTLRRLNK